MKQSFKFFSRVPRYVIVVITVVIIVGVGALVYHSTHTVSASTATKTRPAGQQVTVASVLSLSPNNDPLSVVGLVTSEDEATILSQTSGEIVNVAKQLGDTVSAGDVIATFENSSQQATVLQAQGEYNAALATLANATGVTAVNTNVTSAVADQSAVNAQTSAVAALQSGYADLDDAIDAKADSLFTSPQSADPMLLSYFNEIVDQGPVGSPFLTMVENERVSLESTLANDATLASATSSTQLSTNISTMIQDAQTTETFLNNLAEAVNLLTPNSSLSQSTISGYQSSIAAARSEVTATIANLTTALNSYNNAISGATTATNSANGGTNNAIATAQAQVQEALGAYDAAKSALAKTIVTSPISGTIIALPVTSGDYVSSFSEVAEVSNPSALKIVTHVTAEDAQTISEGNSASINGLITGTVSQIAPAIDPQTGTIEVDIALPANQTGLTDQDSVTVDIDRNVASSTSEQASDSGSSVSSTNIIPIVALKITPTGPIVFTVDSTGALVSNPVQTGSILGDDIVVTQGLTPNMMIVTDGRGLSAGEKVSVKKQ